MATCAVRRSTGPILLRSISPASTFSRRSSASSTRSVSAAAPGKRTCLCAPTNHPGSFRCSLHKAGHGSISNGSQTASYGSSRRLTMWRSAVRNSVARIGTVDGDLVKRALAARIRPSSHQQRRRGDFRRRPSRLSVMSMA